MAELRLDVDQASAWITENQRLHWRVKALRTKAWRTATAWRARADKLPALRGADVVCELRFATRRRRDPNNWAPTAKACIDGLVDAGVFIDDDSTRVTGPDMRIGAAGAGVRPGLRLRLSPRELRDG